MVVRVRVRVRRDADVDDGAGLTNLFRWCDRGNDAAGIIAR